MIDDEIELEIDDGEDIEIEIEESIGGGTSDHSRLRNLDYENSGHIGFASSQDLETETNRATAKETEIEENLETETTSRIADDEELQDAISDEEQARIEAINTVEGKIQLRSLITETGNKIELSLNTSNYHLKAILYDKNDNIISTSQEIDLPIESLIISARYDSATKTLILTLQNGQTISVPLGDLISGLASEEYVDEQVATETSRATTAEEELDARIDEIESDYLTSEDKTSIEEEIAEKSTVTISDLKTTGTKIATITIDEVDYEIKTDPDVAGVTKVTRGYGLVDNGTDITSEGTIAVDPTVIATKESVDNEISNRQASEDTINQNIETLSDGLSEAEQAIQEIQTELEDGVVKSVNTKTGVVVLDATDIKLTTNQQTVEANFIRVDEEINRVEERIDEVEEEIPDVSDFATKTELQAEASARETEDTNINNLVSEMTPLTILSESSVVVSGYTLPALTNEQMEEAYEAFANGQRVIILASSQLEAFVISMVDTKSGGIKLYAQYYTTHIIKYNIDGTIEITKIDVPNENVEVKTNNNFFTYSGDAVTFTTTYSNLKTNETSTKSENIALANSTTAGLMSPTSVVAIQQLREEVDALEGQNIRLSYTIKDNPTANEIAMFVIASGYQDTSKWSSIGVVVKSTNHIWRYYTNTNAWADIGLDTVNQFTNALAGIIKGSTTDGQVYAEDDGTGSVNGWDDLKLQVNTIDEKVDDNTSDIEEEVERASAAEEALQTEIDTKVSDVQINGTSIISNNVANIPIGYGATLGVVGSNNTYGTSINNSGIMRIITANEGEIINKTQEYKPITPSNLDKAIREGLGNNSLIWGDTYKANARATIGAGTSNFSGSFNDLTDQPDIPDELADLSQDSTHRTVTDTEKATWNGKQDAISDLNDIRTKANAVSNKADTTALDVETTARENGDTTLGNRIGAVENKIPTEATAQNQLADKAFVNSTVNSLAAFFRGSFQTKADLLAYTGEKTNNDYAYVVADETHDGESWRYIYVVNGGVGTWTAQFKVNDTPFTQAQLNAINSGITSSWMSNISTNKADKTQLGTQVTYSFDSSTGTLYITTK